MNTKRSTRWTTWLFATTVTLVMLTPLTLLTPRDASAQPRQQGSAAPRTAEEALARHVAAIGGRRALEGITSRHERIVTAVKVVDTMPEVSGTGDVYYLAPKRLLTRTTQGLTTMDIGVNDTVAWMSNGFEIGKRLGSATAALLLRTLGFVPSYQGALEVTFLGERLFEGQRTVAVRVRHAADMAPVVQYFDMASGLMVGTDMEGAIGGDTTRMVMEDYTWFGPERVSVTQRILRGGKQVGTMKVVALEHGPVDATLFDPPAPAHKEP